MQLETYVNGELMSSGFVSAGGRKAADDAKDANNGLGAELGVRSGGIGSGGQLLQGLGAGNREVKVVATEKAWYTPMRRFIPKVFGALRTADITLSTPLVPDGALPKGDVIDAGLRDLDLHFVMQLISVCRESTRDACISQVSAPVARFRDAERAIEPHSRIRVATG